MIREATKEDSNVLANIISVSFRDVARRFSLTRHNCPTHPSNCTSSWIESDMARGVKYFILYKNGSPIGCVGFERPDRETCYLERLSVLPKMRGKHLGTRLVQYIMDCATTLGQRKISIGIIAEQAELKDWYKTLGFVEVGIKTFPHLPFKVCFMEFVLKPAANHGF